MLLKLNLYIYTFNLVFIIYYITGGKLPTMNGIHDRNLEVSYTNILYNIYVGFSMV